MPLIYTVIVGVHLFAVHVAKLDGDYNSAPSQMIILIHHAKLATILYRGIFLKHVKMLSASTARGIMRMIPSPVSIPNHS